MQSFEKKVLDTITFFKKQGVIKHDYENGMEYSEVSFRRTDSPYTYKLPIPNPKFSQPAVNFEQEYGLTGVSGNYNLPESIKSGDLQTYIMLTLNRDDITEDRRRRDIAEVCDALVKLNPNLKKTRDSILTRDSIQDTLDLYHLVMGVASAFNIDDISHFILEESPTPRARKMRESQAFKNLTKTFNKHARKDYFSLGWVASPKTLKLIENKIININYGQKIQLPKKRDSPPAAGI